MIKALKICGYVSAVLCAINTFYSAFTSVDSIELFWQFSDTAIYGIGFMIAEILSGLAGAALSLIGFLSLAEHLENKEEIKRLLSEISQKLDTENNGTWGYYTK